MLLHLHDMSLPGDMLPECLQVTSSMVYACCRCLRSLAEPMSCWTSLWMRTAYRGSSVVTCHRTMTQKPRWALNPSADYTKAEARLVERAFMCCQRCFGRLRAL